MRDKLTSIFRLTFVVLIGLLTMCCGLLDQPSANISSTPTLWPVYTSPPLPTKTPLSEVEIKAEKYIAEYGGSMEVYVEILSLTDCNDVLEFYTMGQAHYHQEPEGTWFSKQSLGIMTAAEDRMDELRCAEKP